MNTHVMFAPFVVFVLCSAASAQEKAPPEKATAVTAVTVYEDRALVSRQADLDAPAGASVVRLAGFPPALSEASLRATVEGDGLKVISVTSRTEQRLEAVSDAVRKAEKELDDLERQRLRLAAQRAAVDQEEAQLNAFQALARQAIAERATMGEADVASYRKAAALFPARQQKLAEERRQIDKDLEALQPKLNDGRANLEKISSRGMKTVRNVEVALEAARAGKAKVTVSYIVHDCGWSPRYEARLAGGLPALSLAGKPTNSPAGKLAFAYQGEVRQKTGEDWKGVRMALSTARPALGAARPDLPRLRMQTAKAEKPKREVASRSEALTVAEDSIAAGRVEAIETGGGETVAARPEDTGISVLFQVPGVADVPSDGRAHKVPVTSYTDEKPELAFETVPKLVPYVYLRCDTSNQTAFPMLAGPVDVWRESGFIGTSSLKFTPPKGKLALSLGIDENLKVRRVTEEDSSREAGLIGGKRVRRFCYRIEVANYHDAAKTVRVRENYPVSDVEEVRVALTSRTTTPKENDAKQGLLMWDIPLAPGETKALFTEYEVTMPKDFAWTEQPAPYDSPLLEMRALTK